MPAPEHVAEVVGEWVDKAENDLKNAAHTLTMGEKCPTDTVCFHAQQCVEKYLKARLADGGVAFPKMHDLGALLNFVLPLEPSWEHLREDLDSLSSRAVEVRYPGVDSDAEDAHGALEIALRIRAVVRPSLKLPK